VKLIRGDEVVEDRGAAAYESHCASCGKGLEVSRFTADLVETSLFSICRDRGWPLPTRDDLALCGPCYRDHQTALRVRADAENARAAAAWDRVQREWPRATEDRRREIERGFRQEFPWYGAALSDWLVRQTAQPKAKARQVDSAAGFDQGDA